jgi:hypothetical protein
LVSGSRKGIEMSVIPAGSTSRKRRVRPVAHSSREAILAYRRVLRLVNGYLGKQKQDLLLTDGKGLMTWGEIRAHVNAALEMKVIEN